MAADAPGPSDPHPQPAAHASSRRLDILITSFARTVEERQPVDDVGTKAGELEAAAGVLDLVGRAAPFAGLSLAQKDVALLPLRSKRRQGDVHRSAVLAVQNAELELAHGT